MKLRLPTRARSAEHGQSVPAPGEPDPTPKDRGQIADSEFAVSATTRIFTVVIVLAVLCGPAALAVVAFSSNGPVQPSGPQQASDGDARLRVSSAAVKLVRDWLSAGSEDAESLAAQVLVPPSLLELPRERPQPPAWVEPVSAERIADGEWTVHVRAVGGRAGRESYFRVVVREDDQAVTPLSIPARVRPESTNPERPGLERVSVEQPAGQTIAGFAGALLAGDGDIERWLSPGSAIQPVGKACSTVELAEILAPTQTSFDPVQGAEVSVLATITCQVKANRESATGHTFQYPLVLRARDGRWEVERYGVTTFASSTAPSVPASSDPTSPPATSR